MSDAPSQRLVLLVEDEPSIADTLVYALRTEGFAIKHCLTGEAGLVALKASDPALVILDVGLPDMSGFDWCKAVRRYSIVPILFLTARNSEVDRVVGLEIGGDDYVTKPFSPREVTARVKAILRRPATMAKTVESETSDWIIDDAACTVRFRGELLDLTRYEFRLICVLAARPGRIYSRDELMNAVWEDPGSSLDRTVDAHIKTIRNKARAIEPGEDPIKTHRGMGYAWTAQS